MINLEVPKKFSTLVTQANYAATEVYRANSRKYDLAEHTYPKELDMLAALLDGMAESGALNGAGAEGSRAVSQNGGDAAGATRNGSNIASVLGIIEMCWGDVGLLLTMPRQGLGQAAIAAVADEEQLKRFGGRWAAMAITDGASRRGDRRVRPERREDLRDQRRSRRADRRLGDPRPQRRPRRDQVVRGRARQPRPEARPAGAQARDPRLGHGQLRARRVSRAEGEPARFA
jgi:hypothetical protein